MVNKSGTATGFAPSSELRGFSAGAFRADCGLVPLCIPNRPRKLAGQTVSKLRYFFAICCITIGGGSRSADAQPYTQFDLGGTHWTIPSAYVEEKSLPPSSPRSVTLQFELPRFTPVNPKDFLGVTPGDALPILSITITDNPNAPSGQPLLNSLMSKVQTNCVWCVADSSLGGKKYSNYAAIQPQRNHLTNGTPFVVYVNSASKDNWFAVCYFTPTLTPLPCERTLKIRPAVTVTFKFPEEYMSDAFRLGSQVRALLANFQLPMADQLEPETQALVFRPSPCWSPAPASPDDDTIPLRLGPEIWHIPAGYAGTFGINQTNDPQVNGFQIYLKLPDLEPLGSNDPSPFLIHGFGRYLRISISYQPDAMLRHPELGVGADGMVVPPKEIIAPFLGRDPFLKYNEFDFIGRRMLLSEIKSTNPETFPPQEVECTLFSLDDEAYCKFQVIENRKPKDILEPDAGYMIEYSFSRDYYSQLGLINGCVKVLFERISGHTVQISDIER